MFRLGARFTALASGLVIALLAAVPAQAARPFNRAITDDVWWTGGPTWIAKTTAAQARVALLEIDWRGVEPTAPTPGWDPTDPGAPNYNFAYVDNQVRQWARTGVSPAFLVTDAPGWAAPGAPSTFAGFGAWRPNATAFGQLAKALARRYSGSYPDPAHPGQKVPRVRFYQAWAEPNLAVHLAPAWVRSGSTWVSAAPGIYRNLLNAFYSGIKSVHSDNVVITAGFAPFGDAPGGYRIPPARFVRDMLCLQGQALIPQSCPNPAHFDALAIDPYEFSAPTAHAFNVDDVSEPDLGKLTRIVKKAVRTGRALPTRSKQLWVTEFSYDSNPPNPNGLSTATQARWLAESFYVFWKQGVNTAVWYLIRDMGGTNFTTAYFSGIYFHNGVRKPSFQAFRFPFVVMPAGKRADVWGISPRGGRLAVQRQQGSSWRTLFRFRVSPGAVFTRKVSKRLRGNFRAVVGGESSLVWHR